LGASKGRGNKSVKWRKKITAEKRRVVRSCSKNCAAAWRDYLVIVEPGLKGDGSRGPVRLEDKIRKRVRKLWIEVVR